jgi:hypothetical protein
MSGVKAIDIALDVYRKPARARALSRQDVPAGMLTVIRIAAGSADEIEQPADGEAAETMPVKDAAVFFLRQLLMNAGNDDYRQLGLRRGASLQEIKDHKRSLLKWLHPDRNPSPWEQVLFGRVKAAADRLEGAIREGDEVPHFVERRRPGRRRMAWRAAHKRMKQPIDWRPRLKKAALAAVVFAAVVGAAQAVFAISNGGSLTSSMASINFD